MKVWTLLGVLVVLMAAGVVSANYDLYNLDNQTIAALSNETFPVSSLNFTYKLCGNESVMSQFLLNFTGTLDPSTLALNDSCVQSNLTIDSSKLQFGSHTGNIAFISLNGTRFFPITINIANTDIWNFSSQNVTLSMNLREFLPVIIGINNTKNLNANVSFSIVDTDKLAYFDTSAMLLKPLATTSRPLYLQTFNATPGIRTINITATDGIFSKTFSIFLTVSDNLKPIIGDADYKNNVSVNEFVPVKVPISDESEITGVKITYSNSNATENLRIFNTTHWEGTIRNTANHGEVDFYVTAVDRWNNSITREFELNVQGLKSIGLDNDIYVGKIKYLYNRSVTIGKAYVSTPLNFKLNYLTKSPDVNSTINVTINGKPVKVGETISFASLSGDIVITLQQNYVYYYSYNGSRAAYSDQPLLNYTISYDTADYFTNFIGELEVITGTNIDLNNTKISFTGDFNKYDVSLPMSKDIPYLDRQTNALKMATFSCWPEDRFVYENSTYNCTIVYPVDIDARDFSAVTSMAAFGNMIDGYERNLTFTASERDTERLKSGVMFWAIIFVFLGFVGYKKVWENLHYH